MPGAYCDPCRCYRNEVCVYVYVYLSIIQTGSACGHRTCIWLPPSLPSLTPASALPLPSSLWPWRLLLLLPPALLLPLRSLLPSAVAAAVVAILPGLCCMLCCMPCCLPRRLAHSVSLVRASHACDRARALGGFIGFGGMRTHMHSKIHDDNFDAQEQHLTETGAPGR